MINLGAVWIQLQLVLVCLCVRMLCIFVSVWRAWWEEHWGRGFVAGDFPSVTHTGLKSSRSQSYSDSIQTPATSSKNLLSSIITLHTTDLWLKATLSKSDLAPICVVHGRHAHMKNVCVSDAAIKNNFPVHKKHSYKEAFLYVHIASDLYTPIKKQTSQMYRVKNIMQMTCGVKTRYHGHKLNICFNDLLVCLLMMIMIKMRGQIYKTWPQIIKSW